MLFRNAAVTNATPPLKLDPATTALVLIDLQQGILPYAQAPYDAASVLANAVQLVDACRTVKSPVVFVKAGFSADGGDALKALVDAPHPCVSAHRSRADDGAGAGRAAVARLLVRTVRCPAGRRGNPSTVVADPLQAFGVGGVDRRVFRQVLATRHGDLARARGPHLLGDDEVGGEAAGVHRLGAA
jgi:hypothetical protein